MADKSSALLAIGEPGVRAGNQHALERLRVNANRLDRIGLSELSAALQICTPEADTSKSFLKAQYIQGLHAQASHMSVAIETT